MERREVKFWVGCPQCGKTIGVPPRFVMQFLERVINQAQGQMETVDGEKDTPPRQPRNSGEAHPPTRYQPKQYGAKTPPRGRYAGNIPKRGGGA